MVLRSFSANITANLLRCGVVICRICRLFGIGRSASRRDARAILPESRIPLVAPTTRQIRQIRQRSLGRWKTFRLPAFVVTAGKRV
jgi:hypothetical protein